MIGAFRIVVGVDGSEGGRRALLWAVREAAARGGTVHAVIAWRWDAVDLPPYAMMHPDEERERAECVLTEEISAIPGFERSGVPIAAEAVEGRAAEVLAMAARSADLLVLGSHGHGRMRHTVMGSVSDECIRRAACPVVVIPTDRVNDERAAGASVPA